MNLAFLTAEYPDARVGGKWGGIGTSVRNLANAYVKLGHNVHVFVLHKSFERFQEDGIDIIPVRSAIKMRGLPGVYLIGRDIARTINKYIAELGIRVIEVPDWSGPAAFMHFNCITVIKYHGSDAYFCKLERRKQFLKNYLLEYLNIRRGNIHVFVSEFAATVTKRLFPIRTGNCHVVHNGINLENFQPGDVTPNAGASRKTILYLGTLIRKKGCLELPSIFNELARLHPDARLVLAGGDAGDIQTGATSTWGLMQPLFADLTKVEYLGPLPYAEVKKLLTEADVCVFPSYAEALPMTWLEAMAMQKPVVASNIGWATEIIDDGKDGFLATPDNHAAFAAKIALLLDNPTLAAEMADAARRKVVAEFDIIRKAAEHVDIYNRFR